MGRERLAITFLGTGTSHGIPMIGCDCDVCRSDDPRDRRNRASVAVRVPDGRVILIDVPPEFRLAALATALERVDAVLLTHAHADHIMGSDDLRRYNNLRGGPIDCYANAATVGVMRRVFGYAEGPYTNPDRPSLRLRAIDGPCDIAGVTVRPVELLHGRLPILGYRIGRFAYCTDVSAIPDASRPLLEDLDLLVLDALRYRPHPTHFNLAEALAAIETLAPRRALLTHIAHEISHAGTSAQLPDNVALAWDGQHVEAEL
ncbi:MAG: MBL fold metallo-hydrolase [Planctomycetes bacterium]|nr:MBL fold metallo-hydrolase [Planctomycetota bacterium]